MMSRGFDRRTPSRVVAIRSHFKAGRRCLRCCCCSGADTSLSVSEGTSNSPDIWNAVNGLNQQGYEGALGAAAAAHQTQPGSYNNLQPTHNHMVRFTARKLGIVDAALLSSPPED